MSDQRLAGLFIQAEEHRVNGARAVEIEYDPIKPALEMSLILEQDDLIGGTVFWKGLRQRGLARINGLYSTAPKKNKVQPIGSPVIQLAVGIGAVLLLIFGLSWVTGFFLSGNGGHVSSTSMAMTVLPTVSQTAKVGDRLIVASYTPMATPVVTAINHPASETPVSLTLTSVNESCTPFGAGCDSGGQLSGTRTLEPRQ